MKVIPKIGTGPMITHLLQGNHQVRSNQHNHCHLPKDFLPLCWYLLAKMCNKEIKCLKIWLIVQKYMALRLFPSSGILPEHMNIHGIYVRY